MTDIVERLEPPKDYTDDAVIFVSAGMLRRAISDITTLRAEGQRLRKLLWEVNEQCPEHVPLSLLAQIRAALADEKPPLADLASRQVDLPPEDKSLLYGNLSDLYVDAPAEEKKGCGCVPGDCAAEETGGPCGRNP